MKSSEFYLTIQRDRVLLSWESQQRVPYRLASGLEKDQLIARILHKVLNLRLTDDETGVLGRAEFKVLGSTLFKLLFNDDALKVHFDSFYKEALNPLKSDPGKRYRLILEFDRDAGEMAILPWEYLYYEEDETHEAFLAAHPKKCIDLIRKLPFKDNWLELDKTQQQIEPPLRLLLIIAQPDDAEEMVNAEETLAYFYDLEKRFANLVEIQILRQPEVDLFEEQLQEIVYGDHPQEPFFPHVVHFLGHSRTEGGTGQLCFVKKSDAGYAENWINEETFAGYFEEWNRLPHLVFLHVCDSVRISSYQEDKGIAIKLVKKGVPFVIALQNPVPDWMGLVLTEKIYDELLAGMDIAKAVTEARFLLARKLMNANDQQYGNYEHKGFGSIALFTSVLQPFALARSEPSAEPLNSTDTYKTCPNHPQIKFIPTETRCSLCNTPLVYPSELLKMKKTETRTDNGNANTPATAAEATAIREATPGGSAQATTVGTAKPSAVASAFVDATVLLMVKTGLKESIRDSLEKCFDKFFTILIKTTSSYNKLIIYEGNLKSAKERFNQNLIDADEELKQRAQVQKGLLDLIDALKEKDIVVDALKRLGLE